jgi:hypothetical protein
LRFCERCPNCGYQETINWRPRLMNLSHDLVEADNVPDLASKIAPGKMLIEGQWAFYRTKTGRWIYRMLASEFRTKGSFSRKYNVGTGSPRSAFMTAANRRAALKRSTIQRRIPEFADISKSSSL